MPKTRERQKVGKWPKVRREWARINNGREKLQGSFDVPGYPGTTVPVPGRFPQGEQNEGKTADDDVEANEGGYAFQAPPPVRRLVVGSLKFSGRSLGGV